MVGWKKFLLIPGLILLYIFLIDFIASSNFIPSTTQTTEGASSEAVTIGVGQAISVSVVRPYFFGLLKLPVYSAALGDISIYHELFFYFIVTLTVIFVLMERFQKKESFKFKGGKKSMNIDFNWKKTAKALAVGIGFGILCFILTGDGGPSVALGLLLIYLDNKFK